MMRVGSISRTSVLCVLSALAFACSTSDAGSVALPLDASLDARSDASAEAGAPDGFLYLFGGQKPAPDAGVTEAVVTTKIAADGTLGAWFSTNAITGVGRRGRSAAIVADSRAAVVIGGDLQGAPTSTVYVGPAHDGQVGPWMAGTATPEPHQFGGVASSGSIIWIASGEGTALVHHAVVATTPTRIESWLDDPPLPAARSYFGMAYMDGVYVVGGRVEGDGGATETKQVLFATPDAGGGLGPWQDIPPLPSARWGACVAAGPASGAKPVFVVGGHSDALGRNLTDVLVKTAGSNDWVPTTTLPDGLTQVACTASRDHLYVLGGLNDAGNASAAVYYASIDPNGKLGSWSTTLPLPVARFDMQARWAF